MDFPGVDRVRLDSNGCLRVTLGGRESEFDPPRVTQSGKPVPGAYRLLGSFTVGFEVGPYDPAKELLIDPVLGYSAMYPMGGFQSLALDKAGNIFVSFSGSSSANCSPQPSKYSTPCPGAGVAKFDPSGTRLLYATHFDSSYASWPGPITVDAQGSVYVGSQRGDPGFYNGRQHGLGVVRKLSSDGSTIFYENALGSGMDLNAIAVDSVGNVYAGATTYSVSGPGTKIGGLAAKISASGSTIWSKTFSGNGRDEIHGVALDRQNNVYIVGTTTSTDVVIANPVQSSLNQGSDVFVAEINADGLKVLFATYLGGSSDDSGADISVDTAGNIFITGSTASGDFPVLNAPDSSVGYRRYEYASGFFAEISPHYQLLYSTAFQGSPASLRIDAQGTAWIAGNGSVDMALAQPIQPAAGGGFVMQVAPPDRLPKFSTYFGQYASCSITGLAVSESGSIWVSGEATNDAFPTVNAAAAPTAIGYYGFFARIDGAPEPARKGVPRVDAMYNAGSYEIGDVIAPGEIVTLIGAELANESVTATAAPLPTSLSDVVVTVGGALAPLFYVSPTQINFQAPTDIPLGQSDLQIIRGQQIIARRVRVTDSRPGVFYVDRIPAITHSSDFRLVTPQYPAHAGEYLTIFCSGLGATMSSIEAGTVTPGLAPIQASDFYVAFGGKEQTITYAGLVPGSIGLYQINFKLGPYGFSKPLELYFSEGFQGTNAFTLYVQ
jgi:uncharacterized protein (TIGR03437 family)